MYTFVEAELEKLAIPGRKIRIEVYGPPSDVTAQPGWPETIDTGDRFKVTLQSGEVIEVTAGEPVMAGLERSGLTSQHPLPLGGMQPLPHPASSGQGFSLARREAQEVGCHLGIYPSLHGLSAVRSVFDGLGSGHRRRRHGNGHCP